MKPYRGRLAEAPARTGEGERSHTFDLDTTACGWIDLLFGLLLVATGFGLFARQTWQE